MRRLILLLALAVALPAAAQTVGPDEALLEWDHAGGAASFALERKAAACAAGGTWAQVTTILGTERSYMERGLPRGTQQCWRIYAENEFGERSGPSNEVGKSIPGLPSAPENLRVR